MTTKTSSSGGVIGLVVVIALGALFFAARGGGSSTPEEEDAPEHALILSLVYIPMGPLTGDVGVLVKEDGRTVIREKHVATPWARTEKFKEGSIVTFRATKPKRDMVAMSCTIHDTDGHLHDSQDLQPGMNHVECKASV